MQQKNEISEEARRHQSELRMQRANTLTQIKAEVLNQGFRGLVWINAVGAGALVTWLQAVWDPSTITPLPKWLLAATAILLFGVFIGSGTFYFRYRLSNDPKSKKMMASDWWYRVWGCALASLLCFLFGMAVALIGAYLSLPN